MTYKPQEPHDDTSPSKKPPRHRLASIFIVIMVVILATWGIVDRVVADSNLHKRTDKESIPTVVLYKAVHSTRSDEVVLPGSLQAWHEAPIYARTNGYLKDWLTDIGAPVKAGDLLAEIDTPEVDAQLHQAEADVATAQANNALAQSTAKRWVDLLKTNSVSKQEADEKVSDAAAKEALVLSAKANLDRLSQLENFKRVTAPFDGVITARNTDTGALINAGSNGVGQELFHIAETDKLRAYVQLPETYTQSITPHMMADLHLNEYPQRTFPATLTRTADALDTGTRTLLLELEVDNAKNELLPGSYAEVHLKLPSSDANVNIPANTLLFRSAGLQVATVGDDGKVKLRGVTIGRDYGKEVEIVSGLSPDESIIVNPPDSLVDGEEVQVVTPEQQEHDRAGKDKKENGDNPKKGDGAVKKATSVDPKDGAITKMSTGKAGDDTSSGDDQKSGDNKKPDDGSGHDPSQSDKSSGDQK